MSIELQCHSDQSALLFDSPLGSIGLLGHGELIERIYLNVEPEVWRQFTSVTSGKVRTLEVLHLARAQIEEYFSRRRKAFNLPLSLIAWTPFCRSTFNALALVPFATTISYTELAAAAGSPHAARAVGGIMAHNPFPLILPCHRVVGRHGELTGFSARGGVRLKQFLLQFEASDTLPFTYPR